MNYEHVIAGWDAPVQLVRACKTKTVQIKGSNRKYLHKKSVKWNDK